MNPTIIIPYRNRQKHIAQFLPYYRKLLPAAKFIVVEQSMNKLFNRAKLLNIGTLYADSDYYAFHDVDMLVQGKPDYSYPENPTLLATNASQFNWKMPFPEYFGGVVLFSRQDFVLCNGYSNTFAGWGGEDNEMYNRVLSCGLKVSHRPHRYLSLPHPNSHPTGYDPVKMEQAKQPRRPDDGLNNLSFEVIGEREIQNGRIITVNI
jgi:predicted glycosyltransferase involved in capsule biosynthesis